MTRVAEHTPTATGRPSLIPWSTEIPTLVTLRHQGHTYAEIAAILTERYGKAVSEQSVRGQFSKRGVITPEGEVLFEQNREQRIQARDATDAERIADFLIANPGTSQPEVAGALDLPVQRVGTLMPQALRSRGGYYIPPGRESEERYTREDIVDAIRQAAAFHGVAPGGEFELEMYETWRATIPQDSHYPASTQVWNRKFRRVSDAVIEAGFAPNITDRNYDGYERRDIIVWLAHWLRDLRTQSPDALTPARLTDYTKWEKANRGPVWETCRKHGSFTELCPLAARMEQTWEVLPERKTRSNNGRHKATCTCGRTGAHTRSGLCDDCAPPCDYTNDGAACAVPAHFDGLCEEHEQQRIEQERAESRETQWRTYYLVYWPQHRAFKVGLEGTGGKSGPQRIKKWQKTGAQVFATIVHAGDNTEHAAQLYDVEQDLRRDLTDWGFAHPDRRAWLDVVGAPSALYPTSPDGWTETFLFPPVPDIDLELAWVHGLMMEALVRFIPQSYIDSHFEISRVAPTT